MKRVHYVIFFALILTMAFGTALAGDGKTFILRPNGKHIPVDNDAIMLKHNQQMDAMSKYNAWETVESASENFTITWRSLPSPSINFGFEAGDTMAMYFKPLAGCTLKVIRLHNQNYEGSATIDVWDAVYDGEAVLPEHRGTGQTDPNGAIGSWDAGGAWVPGTNMVFTDYLLGQKYWGPFPITLTSGDAGAWKETPTFILGEPDLGGEPFFVTFACNRTAGWGFSAEPAILTPWHFFKYYQSSQTWVLRNYTMWVDAVVEYYEDVPPFIENVSPLYTTLSTDPREVTAKIYDVNPTGGPAGVASAELVYTVNGGAEQMATMSLVVDSTYSGMLPGASPGDEISFYVQATDAGGNNAVSAASFTYSIFAPEKPILLLTNDRSDFGGLGVDIIAPYYFWGDPGFEMDVWDGANYGPFSAELVANYDAIIELDGDGPISTDWSGVMLPWFQSASADHPKDFFISDQDYGAISGYADTTFPAGTLEYDYFGIETLGPQDYNYGASGDQANPQEVAGVVDDPISGFVEAFKGDSLKFYHHPTYEIGFDNWADNVVPNASGVTTFVDPNNEGYVNSVRAEGDNWQSMFMSFDPLACNFRSDTSVAPDDDPSYYWVISVENIVLNAMDWMGLTPSSVREIDAAQIPASFALQQNYPNPFNPSTVVRYALPQTADVSLSIYNALGQKVVELVNKSQTAGVYEANWDGRNTAGQSVASGVYVYRLEAGDFTATKKMMFMK